MLPSRLTSWPVKPGLFVAKPDAVAATIKYPPGASTNCGMASSDVLSRSFYPIKSTAAEVGLKISPHS
jgi:hypothetical protein